MRFGSQYVSTALVAVAFVNCSQCTTANPQSSITSTPVDISESNNAGGSNVFLSGSDFSFDDYASIRVPGSVEGFPPRRRVPVPKIRPKSTITDVGAVETSPLNDL